MFLAQETSRCVGREDRRVYNIHPASAPPSSPTAARSAGLVGDVTGTDAAGLERCREKEGRERSAAWRLAVTHTSC